MESDLDEIKYDERLYDETQTAAFDLRSSPVLDVHIHSLLVSDNTYMVYLFCYFLTAA